ncbi:C-5 cytosine-specific DNA methylase [Entomophthora muscae]|uniref:C-5 cytosine-specific DNA methylase n=1 Tax=Entomophthora muscae TaxID=34485 RepID=A0ACC2U1S2_9FUNG|nr:C-5 cytosine-specific DNA methylase [Entomophthora muscae]
MHLGIPNSRTRYYFMAKHVSLGPFKDQKLDGQLLRSDMAEDACWKNFCSTNLHSNFQATPTLSDFFGLPMHNLESYRIPKKIFDKHAMVYDIVHPGANHTCCFTKGYGTYAQATGSILNFGSEPNGMKWEDHRYFTEYEIAQLMGFPISDSNHHFLSFPNSTSLRQRYKLLGNSLNVMVVSKLLAYLLS